MASTVRLIMTWAIILNEYSFSQAKLRVILRKCTILKGLRQLEYVPLEPRMQRSHLRAAESPDEK